jgi:hypothetical protein
MPKEQKGYCRGSKGCKDQLLISKAVLQESNSRKKNKCIGWIDYHKASDSEPHSLIIKSLQLTGINNKIMSFTKKATSYWQKSMCLHREGKIKETLDFEIKLLILQGDSLSPMLF